MVEPGGDMVAIYRRRWRFWGNRLQGRERRAGPGLHAELFCAGRSRARHAAKSSAERGPHVSTHVEWRADETQSRDRYPGFYDRMLLGALNCERRRGESAPPAGSKTNQPILFGRRRHARWAAFVFPIGLARSEIARDP